MSGEAHPQQVDPQYNSLTHSPGIIPEDKVKRLCLLGMLEATPKQFYQYDWQNRCRTRTINSHADVEWGRASLGGLGPT